MLIFIDKQLVYRNDMHYCRPPLEINNQNLNYDSLSMLLRFRTMELNIFFTFSLTRVYCVFGNGGYGDDNKGNELNCFAKNFTLKGCW
jgi:hypothetical protein